MRRPRVASRRSWRLATCAAAAAGAAGIPAGGTAATDHRSPAHLLVYAQEWSLWPSATSVPAGTIDVELWNRGQDAHDLRVRRVNAQGAMVGPIDAAAPVTLSGRISTAVWHLRPGRYELYCAMPGHLELGMHAVITVKAS